jgi:hypothetical protein
VEPPIRPGDYYINDATWNDYVDSELFQEALLMHLRESGDWQGEENIKDALNVTIASDLMVPYVNSTTHSPESAKQLAQAVCETMVEDFGTWNEQIASIEVIDPGAVTEVIPDVRPFRAFILSAVLSCFFGLIYLLLKEIGDDSIWLPGILRTRYGLATIGTVNSDEAPVNLDYLLRDAKTIAVCTVDDRIDPGEVIAQVESLSNAKKEWIPIPTPLLSPEVVEKIREAEAVLLAVRAGSHAGKPLEYVLNLFRTQDITVTATVLWEADESLIRDYYRLPGALVKEGIRE